MNRLARIARQITAVMTPEEIAEVPDREDWYRNEPDSKVMTFRTSDGVGYKVFFHYLGHNELDGVWEVAFEEWPFGGPQSKKPFEVIQNIASIVKTFIRQAHPQYLMVHPTSASRSRLYRTMFKNLIPGSEEISTRFGERVYKLPSMDWEGESSTSAPTASRQAVRSTIGPVYRAGRKPLDQSRDNPPGGFYFARRPRTSDFGRYVTEANITFKNPYTPGTFDDAEVLGFIDEEEAEEILGEGYDPEYYNAETWLEALENSLGEGTTAHWQDNLFIQKIKEAGFDGVIDSDTHGGEVEYVVFSLGQIEILNTYEV